MILISVKWLILAVFLAALVIIWLVENLKEQTKIISRLKEDKGLLQKRLKHFFGEG